MLTIVITHSHLKTEQSSVKATKSDEDSHSVNLKINHEE